VSIDDIGHVSGVYRRDVGLCRLTQRLGGVRVLQRGEPRPEARASDDDRVPRRYRSQQRLRRLEDNGLAAAPTPAQYAELERAARLQTMRAPSRVTVANGRITVNLNLPRQGVSLVRLTW
jgi:hypothetical protein